MSKSILKELETTGNALRTALSRRGTNTQVLMQLMHDFSVASDRAFDTRSHTLVGAAAEQLNRCSRGFIHTLTRDSAPEIISMSLEMFPMGHDYIEEVLDELALDNHAVHRDQIIDAMFRNMTRHETMLAGALRSSDAAKILERAIRIKADQGLDGPIEEFMRSMLESSPEAISMLNRTYSSFGSGKSASPQAETLLRNWIVSNGDLLADAALANDVSQWNNQGLIKHFEDHFNLPRVAAALSIRTEEPSWVGLLSAIQNHGIKADSTFKAGVSQSIAGSTKTAEPTLVVLCAYSLAFDDVMPPLEVLKDSTFAISALRSAADLLNSSDHAALPRLGDAQKVVDLIVSAASRSSSMEPLDGCWLRSYALNNFRYKASLFTQELGV